MDYLYDFAESQGIAAHNFGFYALIMAAMRKADGGNTEKLKAAWPDVYEALLARYNAPTGPGAGLGVLPTDGDVDLDVLISAREYAKAAA